MTKKPSPLIDADALRAQFEALAKSQLHYFTQPRIPTRTLIERLHIPRSNLDNWAARSVFDLDADHHRDGNKARLYSVRDCIMLAAAAQMSALGVPLVVAKALGAHMVDFVSQGLQQVNALSSKDTLLMLYRRAGAEWSMVHYRADGKGPCFEYVKGNWKLTPEVPFEVHHLPPVRIEISVGEFIHDIVIEVETGTAFVVGNADDMRRAADKLDQTAKKRSK